MRKNIITIIFLLLSYFLISSSVSAQVQTGLSVKCNCRTQPFGVCGNYYNLTNIKYRGPCSQSTTGPDTCNAKIGIYYYEYQSCSANPTATPPPGGSPTVTPPAGGSPTVTPDPLCLCVTASNVCSNRCSFNKISTITTYSSLIKCQPLGAAKYQTVPTANDKTDWCRRPERTKGDADGNDAVNFLDYFYWLQVTSGGKIPAMINPDFDGDGVVGGTDRAVIVKGITE